MADHMAAIMSELNLDLDDPNFVETPERVAKMYLEMFHGLREGAEPKVTTFPNDEDYHHMVIEREIPFYSMCAHHFVPFYGHAHIAYIPESRSSACRNCRGSSSSTPNDRSCRSD